MTDVGIQVYSLRNGKLAKYHDTTPWGWLAWKSQDEGIYYYWLGGMDYRASRTLNGGNTWGKFPW